MAYGGKFVVGKDSWKDREVKKFFVGKFFPNSSLYMADRLVGKFRSFQLSGCPSGSTSREMTFWKSVQKLTIFLDNFFFSEFVRFSFPSVVLLGGGLSIFGLIRNNFQSNNIFWFLLVVFSILGWHFITDVHNSKWLKSDSKSINLKKWLVN